MKGWQIKPLGWILLLAVVGLAIYFFIKWLHRPPRQSTEGRQ